MTPDTGLTTVSLIDPLAYIVHMILAPAVNCWWTLVPSYWITWTKVGAPSQYCTQSWANAPNCIPPTSEASPWMAICSMGPLCNLGNSTRNTSDTSETQASLVSSATFSHKQVRSRSPSFWAVRCFKQHPLPLQTLPTGHGLISNSRTLYKAMSSHSDLGCNSDTCPFTESTSCHHHKNASHHSYIQCKKHIGPTPPTK